MTCFLKGRLNSFLNFTGALFQRRKSSKDKLSRLLNFIKKKKKSFGKETLEKKFNICLLPSSTLPVTGGIVKKKKSNRSSKPFRSKDESMVDLLFAKGKKYRAKILLQLK